MPALDIGSYPSQFFFLCFILILSLFISIKFILPDAFSINQIRNYLINFNRYSGDILYKLQIFSKSFLNISTMEKKDENLFLSEINKKNKISEKFFLSPFIFFFLNDNVVLLIAFFISLSGLYLYLRTIDLDTDWRERFVKKINQLKKAVKPRPLLKDLMPPKSLHPEFLPMPPKASKTKERISTL